MFKTLDGIAHPSFDTANRHAEKVYGNALTALAKRLLLQDKYTYMCTFVDENLEEFQLLAALKADIELSAPEEE